MFKKKNFLKNKIFVFYLFSIDFLCQMLEILLILENYHKIIYVFPKFIS